MIQKNRYFRRSKISEAKFRQLVRYFAMDLTATDCAQLCGLSLRSVNSIYLRMRARMAEHCEARSPFVGELKADESYFGPRRVRGLRGRGAGRARAPDRSCQRRLRPPRDCLSACIFSVSSLR